MTAKFIGEEGSLSGQEIALEDGLKEWVAGRDPDTCQLVIEDPAVSRKHLLVQRTEEGFVAENLRPTNPIEINDQAIEAPQVLKHGDSVRIGGVVLRFFEEVPSEASEPPSDASGEGSSASETDSQTEEETEAQTATMVVEADEEDDEEHEDVLSSEDLAREEEELSAINLHALEGSRWMLKVVAGPNTGAEFPLDAGNDYVLGTDPKDCDIIFHDISVSRHHAKIAVDANETFKLEDLDSRNGVLIDGEPIEKESNLKHNNLVTLGTTAFLLCDREGEAITVSSPIFAPMARKSAAEESNGTGEHHEKTREPEEVKPSLLGNFIFLAILLSVVGVLAYGAFSLFTSEEIKQVEVNHQEILADIMSPWPQIQYSFSKSNGRLMLIGHVLKATDRDQIQYTLDEYPWIKSLDNNIVVDEFIWQENNQVLSKNPNWQGVTMISPRPGRFALTGFLKTRGQADALNTYMNLNFAYPALLENQVVVEENIISEVTTELLEAKLGDVSAEFSNGEVNLTGTVAYDRADVLKGIVNRIEKLRGVRAVRNFVIELAEEDAMINLSDQYEVTGFSRQGDVSLNVVINGRILARGDNLDGMTVTAIRPNAIFLEKDGFKYRIDFKK